jgi:hypothetical protein
LLFDCKWLGSCRQFSSEKKKSRTERCVECCMYVVLNVACTFECCLYVCTTYTCVWVSVMYTEVCVIRLCLRPCYIYLRIRKCKYLTFFFVSGLCLRMSTHVLHIYTRIYTLSYYIYII